MTKEKPPRKYITGNWKKENGEWKIHNYGDKAMVVTNDKKDYVYVDPADLSYMAMPDPPVEKGTLAIKAEELHRLGMEIIEQKNNDYRGGVDDDPYHNFRGSEMLGVDPVVGVLLRMQDKFMRVKTFVEKGKLEVKSESVIDALVDIHNYNAILWGLISERINKDD